MNMSNEMNEEMNEEMLKSRGLKNKMVRDMCRNVEYHRGPGGYWILAYKSYRSDGKELGGQVCGQCGQYYASHKEDELMDCVKCRCYDYNSDE